MYFISCFLDAVMVQYLFVHLAPVSLGVLSAVMSIRGLTYLISSYLIAQLMHGNLVRLERLISIGAVLGFVAQILLAPQPFITSWEAQSVSEPRPSFASLWGTVIVSFLCISSGNALIFVPSLPLMQKDAQSHGAYAVEQVAELFVTMMTSGEMIGPLIGGWLTGVVGFTHASLILGLLCVPLLALAVMLQVQAVDTTSHGVEQHSIVPGVGKTGQDDGVLCGPRCAPNCGPLGMVSDGEASFAIRRIPFALAVNETGVCSAPGTPTGRRESEVRKVSSKPWASAPSGSFRRPYAPPTTSR